MSPLIATGAFLDAFLAKGGQPCGESCKSGDFAEAAGIACSPLQARLKCGVWRIGELSRKRPSFTGSWRFDL